jgi:hypothetical protein
MKKCLDVEMGSRGDYTAGGGGWLPCP